MNVNKGINRWEDIASRLIPLLSLYTKVKNKKLIPVKPSKEVQLAAVKQDGNSIRLAVILKDE